VGLIPVLGHYPVEYVTMYVYFSHTSIPFSPQPSLLELHNPQPPFPPKNMAPTAAPTNPLLESLDINRATKPFKNPAYHAPARRNKNLKQILSDSNARAAAAAAAAEAGGTGNQSSAQQQQMQPTYQNIESPPSFRRGNKWCDMTGLPAKYTDPKTKLRFRNGEVFAALRALPAGSAERYLEVRGANVVLK
jgi:INO80 complex subunit C